MTNNIRIYNNVIKALQDAEEVREPEDYIQLMLDITTEINHRLDRRITRYLEGGQHQQTKVANP